MEGIPTLPTTETSPPPKISCPCCSVPFAHQTGLTHHLRTAHNMTHGYQTTDSITVSPPKFKCQICQVPFASKMGLSRHLKTDHPITIQCTDCKKIFKRPNYLNHIKRGCLQKLHPDLSPLVITKVVSLSSTQPTFKPIPPELIQKSNPLIGCLICALSNSTEKELPKFTSDDQLQKHKAIFHPEELMLTHFPPLSEMNLDHAQFKIYCRAFLKSEIEFSQSHNSLCPYCQYNRSFVGSKKLEFIEHLVTSHAIILVEKLKGKLERNRKQMGKGWEVKDDDEIQVVAEVIDLVDD